MPRLLVLSVRLVVLACATSIVSLPTVGKAADEISFNRDVRPILSNFCIRCHGPDEEHREADLRLDNFEGATAEVNGHHAIVPGDLSASEAVRRILSTDADEKMPPPSSELHLTEKQVDILKRWVAAGGKYESHWAFRPLEVPVPSHFARTPAAENPIDAFIAAELNKKNIEPAAQAERRVWLRRVKLDLIGLPPSVDELARFQGDQSPDAFERVVDRLLASPHYGERWGRHWLDQARYADTNGYTVDSDRSIWPYRDWVIRACNADMPFDQFTIEQLAGDLLDHPTQDQLIATGFHRNTLVNQEGGTDAEQFRNEAMVDRVNTTGSVWLGLSVGCAQCHNHKYDPISQREYYQLFAFYNSDQDVNTTTPSLSLPTEEQTAQVAAIDAQLDTARRELSARKEQLKKAAADQVDKADPVADKQADQTDWKVIHIDSASAEKATELKRLDDESWLASGAAGSDRYTLRFKSPIAKLQSLRLDALTHESLPKKGPGTASNGNFVLGEIELSIAGKKVAWTAAAADHSQVKYPAADAIDGKRDTGWAINVDKGSMNVDRTAMFGFQPVDVSTDADVIVTMIFSDKPAGYNLGRFRISVSSMPLPPDAKAPPTDDPETVRLEALVAKLDKDKKDATGKIASTMIMKRAAQPRDSFIHIRGDFLRHGDKVDPNTPVAIEPSLPTSNTDVKHLNRLDLAEWLVDRRNPLVPRVIVNRTWSHFFPRGLVETENDFGIQGTPPTHPELLDRLAADFRDRGWSLKQLHRSIVLSATYRQSSAARPELDTIDPNNKLLARQSRLRVEAEIVRDCALSVSGLLAGEIGGPSVFPPQPDGVYSFTQNKPSWPTSSGADRYRRGLYTFFRRSAPYPMLTTFDTPRFDTTCTARIRSNTPLQSLTLSNDAAMFEMIRAFGLSLASESASDTERIERAFLQCLSRRPSAEEIASMRGYVDSQRKSFTVDPTAARELLDQAAEGGGQTKGGEKQARSSSASSLSDKDAVESAAWVLAARVLINLDEFVTRE